MAVRISSLFLSVIWLLLLRDLEVCLLLSPLSYSFSFMCVCVCHFYIYLTFCLSSFSSPPSLGWYRGYLYHYPSRKVCVYKNPVHAHIFCLSNYYVYKLCVLYDTFVYTIIHVCVLVLHVHVLQIMLQVLLLHL